MAPMGAMMPMAGLPLGVPPPQMMIPGMMPGMMAGPPPLDKSVPPPIASMMAFGLHAPPTITGMQPNHSDDHMDIEMEDEHATNKTDSVNFYSHPPPQLMGNASSSGNAPGSSSGGNDDFQRGDFRRRDRNRSSSRDKDFNKDFRRGGRSGDNERPQRGGEYRNRRDHSNEMEPRRGNRGEYQNDYNNGGNRRSQEIPSLLNVPLGQDDMPNRSNRNNGEFEFLIQQIKY